MILLCFVACLELGFRVFWERPPATVGEAFILADVFADDARCGWRMRPGLRFEHELYKGKSYTFRTNSLGQRGPERRPPDGPGTAGPHRVVVLGDSFAFGWGVEDDQTFSAVLEQRLGDTEVVNLGVSGFNVVQSHRMLVAQGLRYRPEVVVFAFCHNDVMEQTVPDMAKLRAAARAREDRGRSVKQVVADSSYLVGFLRHSVSTIRPLRRAFQAIGLKDADGGFEMLDENVRPCLKEYPESLRKAWNSTAAEILAMHRTCEAARAKLIVAVIPPRQAVVPGELARTLAYVKFAESDFDMHKCTAAVGALCTEHGIGFLDFAPALEAPDDRYYLYFDMHVNAAGHARMGAALGAAVRPYLRPR